MVDYLPIHTEVPTTKNFNISLDHNFLCNLRESLKNDQKAFNSLEILTTTGCLNYQYRVNTYIKLNDPDNLMLKWPFALRERI